MALDVAPQIETPPPAAIPRPERLPSLVETRHIRNWKGNVPQEFAGSQNKSDVLNYGENGKPRSVWFQLREGTQQNQLAVGSETFSSRRLVFAPDVRNVPSSESNVVNPTTCVMRQEGNSVVVTIGDEQRRITQEDLAKGAVVVGINKKVELGIAGFRPEDGGIKLFRTNPLQETTFADKLKQLITIIPLTFLPGGNPAPVEQPVTPIVEPDKRPEPPVVSIAQEPDLTPTPDIPVRPTERGVDTPEKVQEKFLEYEYNEPTTPERSFEGWILAREAELAGVESSTVGDTGEGYYDLSDPQKSQEVENGWRKFEAEHPEEAKEFRQVAREEIAEINGPDMLPELSDKFTRAPVKTRRPQHMFEEAQKRVAQQKLQEQIQQDAAKPSTPRVL